MPKNVLFWFYLKGENIFEYSIVIREVVLQSDISSCQKLVKMDLCQHPSFLLWSKEWGKRESGTAELDLLSMAIKFLGKPYLRSINLLCFLFRLVHKWSVINWLLDRSYSPLWEAEPGNCEELNLSPLSYGKKISVFWPQDWFPLKLMYWKDPQFTSWNDKEKLPKIWKPWQIFLKKCSLQKLICLKA